ncbi:hypothetical protein LUZ60_004910 [Juncus effusus]|nr:hypothetical protein LUZ60_004910 [Juncus effusus]
MNRCAERYLIRRTINTGAESSNTQPFLISIKRKKVSFLLEPPKRLNKRELKGRKMMILGVIFWIVFCTVVVCTGLLRWNEVRYRRKGLPPGTMGWPLFGETTEFLKLGPSFMKARRLRYGNLFKSHILGCPTVVCMDPEINRYILMNEGKSFVPGYPQSMLDILGKWNIAAVHGPVHKSMRGAMLALINPPMIRDQILPKIDEFMRSHVSSWSGKVIDIQVKTKEMALLSSLKQIAGISAGPLSDELKSELFKLVLGTISLPINLPGTNYTKGFEARKKLVEMIKEIIKERRTSKCRKSDILDGLLWNDGNSKHELSDKQIIDLIIALIYSGYETVSTTTMMAVKYLSHHPKVLEELRKEHLEIRKNKSDDCAIDWDDYKLMRFTRAVIFETLRLATVVNGVLRRTTEDVELNGYIIPKGWKIYVYTREINYDNYMYEDPLVFNPWRWLEKNHESHHHFLLFGGGGRLCPGKELGTVEITTFLHYFVTKYRWEEVGENEIMRFPRVQAPNGLHIKVWDL